jgi:hypothetical protein
MERDGWRLSAMALAIEVEESNEFGDVRVK